MRRRPLLALALVVGAGCARGTPTGFREPPPDGETVTCAVTRERCVKGPDTASSVVDERTYYFCSAEAWQRFQDAPQRHSDPP